MKYPWCEGEQIELDSFLITQAISYAYLGRSMNMENKTKKELERKRRATWTSLRRLSKKPPTNGPKTPRSPFRPNGPASTLLRSTDLGL